jgi:hypothetical protein
VLSRKPTPPVTGFFALLLPIRTRHPVDIVAIEIGPPKPLPSPGIDRAQFTDRSGMILP